MAKVYGAATFGQRQTLRSEFRKNKLVLTLFWYRGNVSAGGATIELAIWANSWNPAAVEYQR
jgi:hypothetical protein